jgi:hypothetical protein
MERVSAACMTSQAFGDRIEQVQGQVREGMKGEGGERRNADTIRPHTQPVLCWIYISSRQSHLYVLLIFFSNCP